MKQCHSCLVALHTLFVSLSEMFQGLRCTAERNNRTLQHRRQYDRASIELRISTSSHVLHQDVLLACPDAACFDLAAFIHASTVWFVFHVSHSVQSNPVVDNLVMHPPAITSPSTDLTEPCHNVFALHDDTLESHARIHTRIHTPIHTRSDSRRYT